MGDKFLKEKKNVEELKKQEALKAKSKEPLPLE